LGVELLLLLSQQLDVAVGLLLLVLQLGKIDLALEDLCLEVEIGVASLDGLLLVTDSLALVGFSRLVVSVKLAPEIIDLGVVVRLQLVEVGAALFSLLNFAEVLGPRLLQLLLQIDRLVHGLEAFRVGTDALILQLLAMLLDTLLLSVVLGTLGSFFVFDILKLLLLRFELRLKQAHVVLASLVELGEALLGSLGHLIDCLDLRADIGLRRLEVSVELVDLVEAGHLPRLVVDDILLLLLDVVNGGLNLGRQVLLEHAQVILLLLVLDPTHSLLLLLEDIDLGSR